MPQRTINKRQFKFTGGLNTESGYLAPAPNTWADGLNMIPNLNGEIARRTRLDREEDANTITTRIPADSSLEASSVGEWASAAGDGTLNFAVVQAGSTLYFRPNADPLSDTATFTIDLTVYQIPGTPLACQYVPCQYASGTGRFFIVSAATQPLMVVLDESHTSITVTPLDLKIRDFTGIFPDVDGSIDMTVGAGLKHEPATLSPAHRYNLQNQGWDSTYIGYYHDGKSFDTGSDSGFMPGSGVYPSNVAQQPWGDDSVLVTRADSSSGATFDWSFQGVRKLADKTVTRAPRGRYIISPFGNDRGTVSGVAGLPASTITYTRPTCIAFHAGRAWYSGITGREQSQQVLFSQTGDDPSTFANCYQAADPASKDDSSLVDSDGGLIVIHEAGTILRLVSLQNNLLVICDNGVWQISGGSGGAFKATDYSVSKVTAIGAVAADAVVLVNDLVFYWAEAAIMQVSLPNTSVTGSMVAQSLTDATIATYYSDINALSKRFCQGLYDPDAKLVYWAYNGDEPNGAAYNWKKNKLLILDLRLGAWYPLKFSDSNLDTPGTAYFVGLVLTRAISRGTDIDVNIIDSLENEVLDSNDVNVVISLPTLASTGRVLKFISYVPSGGADMILTAADLRLRVYSELLGVVSFRDWFVLDEVGSDFQAYIETQWEEDGIGADKRFTTHYATIFLKKAERGVEHYDDGGGT